MQTRQGHLNLTKRGTKTQEQLGIPGQLRGWKKGGGLTDSHLGQMWAAVGEH